MPRILFLVLICLASSLSFQAQAGSAIFFHPDGMGVNQWGIVRATSVGADNDLNWDTLDHVAVYKGHLADGLLPTSNGGATAHAYGQKAMRMEYGLLDKTKLSIAHLAVKKGKGLGLVNSGTITEPGTGAFVARVGKRSNHSKIAEQILESGAQVILGGGEQYFLPKKVKGKHGAGKRRDNLNLIKKAQSLGYTVVYSAEELMAIDVKKTKKLLGLFAAGHTFNDQDDEEPPYSAQAPSIAMMIQQALTILQAHYPDNFLLVSEEEGPDNFGNKRDVNGVLEAGRRADEAIGVIQKFIKQHPRATMVMTSDSDAGGLQATKASFNKKELFRRSSLCRKAEYISAAPDRSGKTHVIKLLWTGKMDLMGGVVVRASGKYGRLVRGTMDNTEIYNVLYAGLFNGAKP